MQKLLAVRRKSTRLKSTRRARESRRSASAVALSSMFVMTKFPSPCVQSLTQSFAHCVSTLPCQYVLAPKLSPFSTKGGLIAFGEN